MFRETTHPKFPYVDFSVSSCAGEPATALILLTPIEGENRPCVRKRDSFKYPFLADSEIPPVGAVA